VIPGEKKLIIIRGRLVGDQAIFNPNDPTSVLVVAFNPNEFSVEKTSQFSSASIPGLDSPILQFSRGDAQSLSLELLLDTYATQTTERDVRKAYIAKLQALVLVDGHLHAPPPCKIVWGSFEFVGVVESLGKRYIMFLDDGTPVRARVTLRLKEYLPVSVQLRSQPRSSPDRRRVHIVADGEQLWQIAYGAYGDPRYWKLLAEANDLDNPRRLEAGREIVIPALESERGGVEWR